MNYLKINQQNAFSVWKGRVALYAILKAIGIKSGDEVLLPGFTCIVVPNAIMYLGAKPVYIEIDPKTYNINPEEIENGKGSKWEVGKAKVIIAQHTFGIPAEMDVIIEIARKYNLYVIEDSCHTIGSKYKGKDVGTFGDAAFFSSQWTKAVTTGLGGWAVVNNAELKEKINKIHQRFMEPSFQEVLLLRLQYYAYSKFFKPSLFWFIQNAYRKLSKLGIAIGSSSNEELECKMPEGYRKKMSEWQLTLLEKKLEEIDKYINHRRWITTLYEGLLKEKGIETVKLPEKYEPVFLRYPILVRDKKKVLNEAKKRKIELGDWWLSPVHPNLERWEEAGYKKGICPIAEEICQHLINLPTHTGINKKGAEEVIEFLADI